MNADSERNGLSRAATTEPSPAQPALSLSKGECRVSSLMRGRVPEGRHKNNKPLMFSNTWEKSGARPPMPETQSPAHENGRLPNWKGGHLSIDNAGSSALFVSVRFLHPLR